MIKNILLILMVCIVCGCTTTHIEYDPKSGALKYTKHIVGKESTKGFKAQLGETPSIEMAERTSESNLLQHVFEAGLKAGKAAAGIP